MTPAELARSVLRDLDATAQRAEARLDSTRTQAAESKARREARDKRLAAMTREEYEKAQRDMGLRNVHNSDELKARDRDVDERWEREIVSDRIQLMRATGGYEGARRMAVELGVIPGDEWPRWVKESQ